LALGLIIWLYKYLLNLCILPGKILWYSISSQSVFPLKSLLQYFLLSGLLLQFLLKNFL
jgi:hypothetical protein